MAIGPTAARMKSGRIVVVATFYAVVGAIAVVLGAGPLLVESGGPERRMGGIGVILGAALLVSGAALYRRTRWARPLGILAGFLTVGLGSVVLLAMVVTIVDGCGAPDLGPSRCQPAEWAIALGALAVVVAGASSIQVVRRARRSYFDRRPRRSSGR